MSASGGLFDLEQVAQNNLGRVMRNLTTPELYEEIVRSKEGHLAHLGAVVVRSNHFAKCSPDDRFIVSDQETQQVNPFPVGMQPLARDKFQALYQRLKRWILHNDLYVQDCYIGANPRLRIPIRTITQTAWHSLFIRNLYHQIASGLERQNFEPAFSLIHCPDFQSIPETDGTHGSAFVVFEPTAKLVLIGGTGYAGEIRHSLGSITAMTLAERGGVLPMRCAVNIGEQGDVAAFVGRTGNGKTALAVCAERRFLGDHEHVWTADGLVSLHWGCYAKVCELSQQQQPVIFECTRRFGTILENVTLNPRNRRLDFVDCSLTDNSRAAFPLTHLPHAIREGQCAHPDHLFLLTRDTTGVLPPVARLDADQAVFAFLLSYAFSLVETEQLPGQAGDLDLGRRVRGLAIEDYAKQFLDKIVTHGVQCWLLNTGWCPKPYKAGQRIDLRLSQTLVKAVLSGQLDEVEYEEDPLFGFAIPKRCAGVVEQVLNPRSSAPDKKDYEARATHLAATLIRAFERFEKNMPQSVRQMVANVVIDEQVLAAFSRQENL